MAISVGISFTDICKRVTSVEIYLKASEIRQ